MKEIATGMMKCKVANFSHAVVQGGVVGGCHSINSKVIQALVARVLCRNSKAD